MNGFLRGFRDTLPVAVSVLAYGTVMGVLAARQGIPFWQLVVMNTTVFAGTAQFVMVEMWQGHLPLVEMTVAVFVMNLRYFLVGASLRPLFAGHPLREKLAVMHFVADENWAVTMAAQRKGEASVAYLFGGGLCVFLFWGSGTLAGHGLGAAIAHPEAFALDFALVAMFLALVVGVCRGKGDLAHWAVAGAVALFCARYLPGKWYILAGGVGGAASAALFGKEAP